MRNPQRNPNRQAVAKAMRELKILYTNTKARRQPGLGEAEIRLRTDDTTKNGGAA